MIQGNGTRSYRKRPDWTPEQDALLSATLCRRNSAEEDYALAAHLGRSIEALRARRSRLREKLDYGESLHLPPDAGADYIPTPELIAEAAAKIRAKWSEVTRVSRIVDDRIAATELSGSLRLREISERDLFG